MMINKRLINLCKSSKKYILLTTLVNWVAILCNIMIIFLLGQFINKVYLGERLNLNLGILGAIKTFNIFENVSLFSAIGIIISLLFTRYICNSLQVKFSILISEYVRVTLRELMYKKILSLGVKYNKFQSTSAITQVIIEGIEQLEIYFGRYLPQLFYALLAPITLFIFMSFISKKVAIVFILAVPLIPISIIVIMKIAKKLLKDYWNLYANLGDSFLENLQGLTTLKVFNMDEEKHKEMNKESERFRKITMKVLTMQLNSITIMDVVAFGGAAIGIIVALNEFKSGRISIGSLLIVILLSSEFFIPLRLLGSYFHIAMNGIAASDKIFSLLDAEEEGVSRHIKDGNFKETRIEIKNLSFSYDGEREVLSNINIEVEPKSLVGIVGESGSGKSTLATIISGNYDSYKGDIFINDINLKEVTLDCINENISVVSTNSYIFNGTILDNLLMGNSKATSLEIEEALKKARLYNFIQGLKEGLMTKVGEGGNLLSGGQKQRLALARVVLSNKNTIIFDEATSNIDVESEESIWESIYELAKEKTVFVISHRLANMKGADRIYVIDKGTIIEKGSHKELIEKNSHYGTMFKRQDELEKVREVC